MLPLITSSTEIAARETLEQVMADALSKCGSKRSSVRAVCMAVSGVNHPTDQQRILSWLRLLNISTSFIFWITNLHLFFYSFVIKEAKTNLVILFMC